MVYVRDQQLEEKLHLLKHRERLQHLLLQQCQPGQRGDGDTKLPPGERPLSPWLGIAAGCKEERFFLEDAADGKEEKELWPSRERSELRAKVKEARDEDADAPLDLSDSGRGRDADWHCRREPRGCGSPRDSPGDSPAARGPGGGHRAQRDELRCPYRWPGAARPLPGAAKEEEEEEEEDAAVVSTVLAGSDCSPLPTSVCPALLLASWPALIPCGRMGLMCVKPICTCQSSGCSVLALIPHLPPSVARVSIQAQGQQCLCPLPQAAAGGAGLPANTPQCTGTSL